MADPLVGARVRVPRFRCPGTVAGERFGGHELSVKLDPPLTLVVWVKRGELELESGGPLPALCAAPAPSPSTPLPAAPPRRQEPAGEEDRRAWRARVGRNVVEALRFGIVPRYAVEALSVGLDQERRAFAGDLARARASGAVRVIEAPYGAGKTHALDVLAMMALCEGFVVARAELDAFECQANRPRDVYRALVRNLRVPGVGSTGRGLEVLLDRAVRSEATMETFARRKSGGWHEFLSPALINWEALDADPHGREALYQWISGEDVDLSGMRARAAVRTGRQTLYSLGSYTTLSSHFTYLIGGLSGLCRLVGFSGLAVLLDEAEHLRLLDVEMEARAIDFFKGLVANALPGALPAGYLSGSYLGGHKKLPFQARVPAHLLVAVACTPVPGQSDLLRWMPDRSSVLSLSSELSTPVLESLVERIATTYRWAFPAVPPPVPAERQRVAAALELALASGALKNLRQAVQTIVTGLDLVRARPGWTPARLADEVAGFARGGR